MIVTKVKYISRWMLRDQPHVAFLFGDNRQRIGFGGQAKAMRGEPNAIGVVTKKWPSNGPGSFLTDDEYEENCRQIDEDLKCLDGYSVVVIPEDGLGTGLARLPEMAPRTFAYLEKKLEELNN